MEHIRADVAVGGARRVRTGCARYQSGAARARLHLLGPVCGDAVLSFGARRVVTGDMSGTGGERRQADAPGSYASAAAIDAGLRQRAPSLAVVRDDFLRRPGALPPGSERKEEVSLPQQASVSGLDQHRSVR